MFRNVLSVGVIVLLAGAAVVMTPESGLAQHGGGHGGGGPFGGSFHPGGFHPGGFHPGGFGGFGGFHPGDFGVHNHFGRNYAPYYGYYGAAPSNYGSYPFSDFYPYSSSSDASSPGSDGSYGNVTPTDTEAQVTVSVPADAEIWFMGTKMTATGSVREYQSPPLTPGSLYSYEVRARWNENGHEVTQTQRVEVTAGEHVNVHFPVLPTTAPTAPSH